MHLHENSLLFLGRSGAARPNHGIGGGNQKQSRPMHRLHHRVVTFELRGRLGHCCRTPTLCDCIHTRSSGLLLRSGPRDLTRRRWELFRSATNIGSRWAREAPWTDPASRSSATPLWGEQQLLEPSCGVSVTLLGASTSAHRRASHGKDGFQTPHSRRCRTWVATSTRECAA